MSRMNTTERRVENLKNLLKGFHTQKDLAEALSIDAGYLSQLLTGRRPITEKTARTFEKRLKLEPGTLDLGEITDYSKPKVYNLDNAVKCTDADYYLVLKGNEFAAYSSGAMVNITPWTDEQRELSGFAVIRPKSQKAAIVCLALNPGSESVQFAQIVDGKPLTHQDFVHSENDAEILGAISGVVYDPLFDRR